jgi:AcrR family transcriptional regulator
MPPHADLLLEQRILKAAQRLWRTHGEHGLTLRAVAKDAGTTTPTVYKRFRNREALLVALATRFRDQLNEELFATKTVEELPCRYLDWAEQHPHEYHLLFRSWADVIHPDLPRPGRMWLMQQLANRFGGTRDQYARAFTALFLLAHGAADLLTTTTDDLARNEVRSHFLAAAGALLNNIAILQP